MESDCTFCALVAGRQVVPGGILYQDESWYVCHCPPTRGGTFPLPGMLVMATTSHVEDLGGLSTQAARRKGMVEKFAVQVIQGSLAVDTVYLFPTDENSVHVHAYLIPKYEVLRGGQLLIQYQVFQDRTWHVNHQLASSHAQALAVGWRMMTEEQPGALLDHVPVTTQVSHAPTILVPTLSAAVMGGRKRHTMSMVKSTCCNAPLIRPEKIGPLLCNACKNLAFDPGTPPTTGHPTQ